MNSQNLPRRRFLSRTLLGSGALLAPQILHGQLRKNTGSDKKGICISVKGKHRNMVEKLQNKWTYTWGPNKPSNLPEGVDFAPMIWGYWGQNNKIIEAGVKAKEQGFENLLGFNEPDKKKQSNMSVEKALQAWPTLEETGLRLGSPACAHPDNEWMKSFMEKAKRKGLRIDFVCVHSYGNTNSQAFLNRMEKIIKLYRKPIWITKFAVGDWQAKSAQQNKHKPKEILKFMEKTLPKLDRNRDIERYAWFPAPQNNKHLGTSALYTQKGALTTLGEFYRDH